MAALYQQLCPVLFGDNAVGEMAKQIAEKGYKHVFICCDAGVRKAGIVELVENALTCIQHVRRDPSGYTRYRRR